MDFKNKQVVVARFSDAAYDLAKATIALNKLDQESHLKHSRDAGEAISQSIELALNTILIKS